MGKGLGMHTGMSGPTQMRHVADRSHKPSSIQERRHWHTVHTHSQPHSGGIGSPHFHWGTAEHGFFYAFMHFVVNTFSTFG